MTLYESHHYNLTQPHQKTKDTYCDKTHKQTAHIPGTLLMSQEKRNPKLSTVTNRYVSVGSNSRDRVSTRPSRVNCNKPQSMITSHYEESTKRGENELKLKNVRNWQVALRQGQTNSKNEKQTQTQTQTQTLTRNE